MGLAKLIESPPIACPHCSANLRAAIESGHDYCPTCGFEFRVCRHCGADIRDAIRMLKTHCPACDKLLRPDTRRLPDDEFWESGRGSLVRALIFICALCALIAVALVGVRLIAQLLQALR